MLRFIIGFLGVLSIVYAVIGVRHQTPGGWARRRAEWVRKGLAPGLVETCGAIATDPLYRGLQLARIAALLVAGVSLILIDVAPLLTHAALGIATAGLGACGIAIGVLWMLRSEGMLRLRQVTQRGTATLAGPSANLITQARFHGAILCAFGVFFVIGGLRWTMH